MKRYEYAVAAFSFWFARVLLLAMSTAGGSHYCNGERIGGPDLVELFYSFRPVLDPTLVLGAVALVLVLRHDRIEGASK